LRVHWSSCPEPEIPVIHLVRHGQASFGTDDYDVLASTGRLQAALAGRELLRRGVRTPVVASGSLSRQRDTAAIVSAELGQPSGNLLVDTRLDEFDAHAMVAEGLGRQTVENTMTSAEFQQHLNEAFIAWIEGQGTSWTAFSLDAVSAISDFSSSIPKGSDGIVATSAGVTAAIVGVLLGSSAAGIVALNKASVNASITTVLSGASGLTLLTYNDHAHLLGHEGMLTMR
jgi:broad specificity phosphatase PhoE